VGRVATINGTSINARNRGGGAPPFCLFLCSKMGISLYVNVGLGVAQTSREKGCLWRGFPEMTAEETNAGQDEERGRTHRFS